MQTSLLSFLKFIAAFSPGSFSHFLLTKQKIASQQSSLLAKKTSLAELGNKKSSCCASQSKWRSCLVKNLSNISH